MVPTRGAGSTVFVEFDRLTTGGRVPPPPCGGPVRRTRVRMSHKSGSTLRNLDVEGLIGRIYAGATEADVWPSVFEQLTLLLCSETGAIVARDISDLENTADRPVVAVGTDPSAQPRWNYYRQIEPAVRFVPRQRPHTVITAERLGLVASVEDNEFFQDFYRPLGLERSLYAWTPWPDGLKLGLVFHRRRKYGPFDSEECEFIARLMPHLFRAAGMWHRIGAATEAAVASFVVDGLAVALLAVDASFRVRWANEEGARLLRCSKILRESNDGLAGQDGTQTRGLRRAIGAALEASPKRARHSTNISDKLDRVVAHILIMPMPKHLHQSDELALVVVDQVMRKTVRAAQAAADIYGLTPAETRVARAILERSICEGRGARIWDHRRHHEKSAQGSVGQDSHESPERSCSRSVG